MYTALGPPAFSIHPRDRTVDDGQSFTLTSRASGGPSYQWQVSADSGESWDDIPDATSANYELTADIDNDGLQYRVVATNSVGTATSEDATVTVIDASLFDDDSVTFDNDSITFDQGLV